MGQRHHLFFDPLDRDTHTHTHTHIYIYIYIQMGAKVGIQFLLRKKPTFVGRWLNYQP